MVTLRTPGDGEVESFLAMFRQQLGADEDAALDYLGITWDDLAGLFRSVGEIRTVEADTADAGFVWIEVRERELHVHAIVLHPHARGRGIGRQVFDALSCEFRGRADLIELGVQESNARAMSFYQRLGFLQIERESAPGYRILRRDMSPLLGTRS